MGDAAEDKFIGGHGPEDGSVERRRDDGVIGWIDGKDLSIGSIACVWATDNTRAAIWDAMKRRETFATSGPRIKIRMFGSVGLAANLSDPVASWTDDAFDPAEGAFYYARVLEIPTPRWTIYDAVRNNLPLLEDVPAIIQERAWGSPIWYAPE